MFLVKAENWGKTVTAASEKAQVHQMQERNNSVVVLDGFYRASSERFMGKTIEKLSMR